MYNRNYISNDTQTNGANKSQSSVQNNNVGTRAELVAFLRTTYQLFASSLLAGAVGAYVGIDMVQAIADMGLFMLVIWIGLLVFVLAVKEKPGINLLALFAFTFFSGLIISPIISMALSFANGGSIIAQAFLMTSVAFGGISFFAMTTKKDFSAMGQMLYICLLVFAVAMLSNFFFQSPLLQLGLSMVGVILFSAFILYDTQQIIQGKYATPIEAAISLYLDFFNLFVSLLQILIAFAGGNDD